MYLYIYIYVYIYICMFINLHILRSIDIYVHIYTRLNKSQSILYIHQSNRHTYKKTCVMKDAKELERECKDHTEELI
jgi:hypothetical protein